MASVISLGGYLKNRAARPLPLEPAEVVIFPGVRVERLHGDQAGAQPLQQRRIPTLQNQATAEELD